MKSLETWYNTSPGNFCFAVKVPRLITHYKKFTDCRRLIDDCCSLITIGLKEKLGSVLFQLPPKYIYTNHRLELIVKSMYKELRNVIESRDASWWTQDVFARLRKEQLIFCGIDYPGLPKDVIIINKTVYHRFHGRTGLYYSVYTKNDLKTTADTILSNKQVTEACIFFNNTATLQLKIPPG